MLEVCKMRKIGYCTRIAMEDFEEQWQWYAAAQGVAKGSNGFSSSAILQQIEKNDLLHEGEWVVGKTKVFLKDGEYVSC